MITRGLVVVDCCWIMLYQLKNATVARVIYGGKRNGGIIICTMIIMKIVWEQCLGVVGAFDDNYYCLNIKRVQAIGGQWCCPPRRFTIHASRDILRTLTLLFGALPLFFIFYCSNEKKNTRLKLLCARNILLSGKFRSQSMTKPNLYTRSHTHRHTHTDRYGLSIRESLVHTGNIWLCVCTGRPGRKYIIDRDGHVISFTCTRAVKYSRK